VKNFVFSRSKKTSDALQKAISAKKKVDTNVEIVNSDVGDFVRRLKKKKGKGIVVFGGGALAKSLFEEDLIDELVLNIHPILLGSGIPLFHEMKRQIDLDLADWKVLKGGYLAVTYRVKH